MTNSIHDPQSHWPLVSALFITYKRVHHLERAVLAFRQNTDYPNLQIVIADDGSPEDIQAQIRRLPADVFALLPKNRGLGANNNNGIRHCSGKYILMIQDDWICQGPPHYLRDAVSVMEQNPNLGIINFASILHPPDHNLPLRGSSQPCFVTPKPSTDSNKEEFLYSDQPHLRSRKIEDTIGYYLEDRDMERCEIDYSARWKHQTELLTAVFPAYHYKVFTNPVGREESFRVNRLRYRVAKFFQPAKAFVPKPLIGFARNCILWPIYLMERLRLTR
jgi:hypothetical protein